MSRLGVPPVLSARWQPGMIVVVVITVPFSRLAFDVVGPLPRTKSGYKYILTCMCYASKYPEAIPLKKVDAQSVAEAMVHGGLLQNRVARRGLD